MSFVACLLVVFSLFGASPSAGADVPPATTPVARMDGLEPLAPVDAPDAPGAGGLHAQGTLGARTGDHAAGAVSEPTRTPIVFSMVGFELDGAAREVEFRTSADGETWGAWTSAHVHTDEGPDATGTHGGGFTEPVWVGDAGWIQVRTGQGATTAVGVELVDATGASRSLATRTADAVRAAFAGGDAAHAAVPGQPDIVSRAEWGADESLRRGEPRYADDVRFGVVHHTAGTNEYTAAQGPAVVRGVYAYHVESRGWSDIGYQFLVDRYGRIYEGRYGGVTRGVVGAHAGGFNTGSFGVSLMGEYSATSPTSAQYEALAELLAWKFALHHIDPLGTTEQTSGGSTRYTAGTTVSLHNLSGHRDVSLTTCPAGAYGLLDGLRAEILARTGPLLADPRASTSTVRLDRDGTGEPVRFTAVLRPAGAWTLEVTDGAGTVVHHAAGEGSSVDATWTPTALEAGDRLGWTLASPGRPPVSGTLDVVVDLVDRVGDAATVSDMLTAIARAAFPGTGSARHAVLARDDVFADALAGGPLAGTDGPVLFTPSHTLDGAVRAELERVLPAGGTVYLLGGEAALDASVAAALAPTWNVVRLAGADRFETAVAIGEVVRERSGTDTVMVARAGPDHVAPWADALAGGAYGARAGVPVLLTKPEVLHPATAAAIGRWGTARTIALGGSAAIAEPTLRGLPDVRRVAGADRSATSAEVARVLWGRSTGTAGQRVALADGYRADAWMPALAASPFAARVDAPLLLTEPDVLSEGAATYLAGLGHGPDNLGGAYAIGTPWRISDGVRDAASALLQ